MKLSSVHAVPTTVESNSIDYVLLSSAMLLVIGLIMMTSASMDYSAEHYGSPFYHMQKHSFYMLLAVFSGVVVSKVPMQLWQQYGWILLLLGIVLLCVVLVPGIGKEVNGSRRWIALGPLTLQASEVLKICVILYIAGYLVRRQDELRQEWKGFVKPIAVLSIVIVLLLLEPDFGAVVVLMGACLGMIFLAGVRLSQFLTLIVVSLLAVVAMAMSSEYRMRRLLAFSDPWADQFNSGYQLTQSLIAFGRGEWFGAGLGNSVQKLFYLPEAHTDFVFAILAEELGLVGVFLVIGLFVMLVLNIFKIAKLALEKNEPFMAYVASGTALIIAGQAFINIGVNAGLLPTKGLTLPFVSYGGSSLIACCVLIGLVFRINTEVRLASRKTVDVKVRKKKKSTVSNTSAIPSGDDYVSA